MSSLYFVLKGSLVTSKSTCGRVLINIELKKKSVPSKPTSCRSCQVAAATVPLSHHTVNIVDVDYIQNDEHQLLSLFSKILMIHPLIKQGSVPLSRHNASSGNEVYIHKMSINCNHHFRKCRLGSR